MTTNHHALLLRLRAFVSFEYDIENHSMERRARLGRMLADLDAAIAELAREGAP